MLSNPFSRALAPVEVPKGYAAERKTAVDTAYSELDTFSTDAERLDAAQTALDESRATLVEAIADREVGYGRAGRALNAGETGNPLFKVLSSTKNPIKRLQKWATVKNKADVSPNRLKDSNLQFDYEVRLGVMERQVKREATAGFGRLSAGSSNAEKAQRKADKQTARAAAHRKLMFGVATSKGELTLLNEELKTARQLNSVLFVSDGAGGTVDKIVSRRIGPHRHPILAKLHNHRKRFATKWNKWGEETKFWKGDARKIGAVAIGMTLAASTAGGAVALMGGSTLMTMGAGALARGLKPVVRRTVERDAAALRAQSDADTYRIKIADLRAMALNPFMGSMTHVKSEGDFTSLQLRQHDNFVGRANRAVRVNQLTAAASILAGGAVAGSLGQALEHKIFGDSTIRPPFTGHSSDPDKGEYAKPKRR